MLIRSALVRDIPQIQFVRNAVLENRLSDPRLVPDADVEDYMLRRGHGWVCEIDGKITGFSIVSLTDQNVWALFVLPEFEKQGIGSALHKTLLQWYFEHTDRDCWLSTAPGTRAETFYRKAGWRETGTYGKGEVKFEMTRLEWQQRNRLGNLG